MTSENFASGYRLPYTDYTRPVGFAKAPVYMHFTPPNREIKRQESKTEPWITLSLRASGNFDKL